MLIRRFLIGIIIAGLVTSAWFSIHRAQQQEAFSCTDCNIVLISIDSFSAKHSSVYNPVLTTTPFLKELAKRSVVFTNAYAQSSWQLPSHAALLTGVYPWDFGIWTGIDALPQKAITLGEILKEKGYATGAFVDSAFITKSHGFDQGFDTFENIPYNGNETIFTPAETWIGKQQSETPFFLFVQLNYLTPPYPLSDPKDRIPLKEIIGAHNAPGGLDTATITRYTNAYYASLQKTDAALAEFFTALDESGLSKKTIVVITAGSGEELGEHGSAALHSFTVYKEAIHVPLLIVMPKQVRETVITPVEIRSIPSTVLALLAVAPVDSFAAPSLVPIIEKKAATAVPVRARTAVTKTQVLGITATQLATPIIASEPPGPTATRYTDSVITGNWHAIQTADGHIELYNMARDSNEAVNLFDKLYSFSPNERATAEKALDTLRTP